MTAAEKFSVTASLAAVLVSSAAAYFQFFWENQDFRIQWFLADTGFPTLRFEKAEVEGASQHILINMSPTMVLMNRGNQNVIVTNISMELLYSKGADPSNVWSHGTNPELNECGRTGIGGALASWETISINGKNEESRPLVIEPGKSVPVRIYFHNLLEIVDKSWTNDSEVTTCFYFRLIDLNGKSHDRKIPAFRFGSGGGKGMEQSAAIALLN